MWLLSFSCIYKFTKLCFLKNNLKFYMMNYRIRLHWLHRSVIRPMQLCIGIDGKHFEQVYNIWVKLLFLLSLDIFVPINSRFIIYLCNHCFLLWTTQLWTTPERYDFCSLQARIQALKSGLSQNLCIFISLRLFMIKCWNFVHDLFSVWGTFYSLGIFLYWGCIKI